MSSFVRGLVLPCDDIVDWTLPTICSCLRAQIIGMSATMSGLEAMGRWLNARLFLTNFRPVPLTEHAVFAGTVFKRVRAAPRP